jgi:hypothetical protein
VKLFLDHIDHNVVANKSALIHYFLRFSAEGGLLCDLSAQHITSSLGRISVLFFQVDSRSTHQMADAVLVLDFWCLSTLPCKTCCQQLNKLFFAAASDSPAPGGPIKIIRIDSETVFGLFPPSPSLCSSWCTRASSLWTRSLRSETVLSVMGAMMKKSKRRGPDQGLQEKRRKSEVPTPMTH